MSSLPRFFSYNHIIVGNNGIKQLPRQDVTTVNSIKASKTVKTFDDIAIRRPQLAESYLELLIAQPGRPIALFAPRRVGKTDFLDKHHDDDGWRSHVPIHPVDYFPAS